MTRDLVGVVLAGDLVGGLVPPLGHEAIMTFVVRHCPNSFAWLKDLHCNRALGLFGDDPARLAMAAGDVSHHRHMRGAAK